MTETLTPIRGPALSLGSELTIAQAAQHRETLVDAAASAAVRDALALFGLSTLLDTPATAAAAH